MTAPLSRRQIIQTLPLAAFASSFHIHVRSQEAKKLWITGNPAIDKPREIAINLLKPTQAQIEHAWDLHFGSVVAATGSYADALAHGGTWHLRIDDLDPPRVAAGATTAILRCLEALGFEWDGPVVHQSERGSAYRAAVEALRRLAPVYPCACSRAEIAAAGLPGIEGPRYPGTCRSGPRHPERPPAWRLVVPATPVTR